MGELVWAKTSKKGLQWPSLICPDSKGYFKVVTREETHDSVHYHSQFLGTHTSGWVDVNNVEPYGAGKAPTMEFIKKQPVKIIHQYQQAFLAAEEMLKTSREENLLKFTVPDEDDTTQVDDEGSTFSINSTKEFIKVCPSKKKRSASTTASASTSTSKKPRQSLDSSQSILSQPESGSSDMNERTGDPLLDESLVIYAELKRDLEDFMQSQESHNHEE
eukprot:m.10936 g.10936  ORF g.10936 m.10936 type:complete len:218 (+) comp22815_c0_seq1:331-984(+)